MEKKNTPEMVAKDSNKPPAAHMLATGLAAMPTWLQEAARALDSEDLDTLAKDSDELQTASDEPQTAYKTMEAVMLRATYMSLVSDRAVSHRTQLRKQLSVIKENGMVEIAAYEQLKLDCESVVKTPTADVISRTKSLTDDLQKLSKLIDDIAEEKIDKGSELKTPAKSTEHESAVKTVISEHYLKLRERINMTKAAIKASMERVESTWADMKHLNLSVGEEDKKAVTKLDTLVFGHIQLFRKLIDIRLSGMPLGEAYAELRGECALFLALDLRKMVKVIEEIDAVCPHPSMATWRAVVSEFIRVN